MCFWQTFLDGSCCRFSAWCAWLRDSSPIIAVVFRVPAVPYLLRERVCRSTFDYCRHHVCRVSDWVRARFLPAISYDMSHHGIIRTTNRANNISRFKKKKNKFFRPGPKSHPKLRIIIVILIFIGTGPFRMDAFRTRAPAWTRFVRARPHGRVSSGPD